MPDELRAATPERDILEPLGKGLRTGTGVDFHSLHQGAPLVLAGVAIAHTAGFRLKRSDGDPLSHAIVHALLAALVEGDIADWFDDQDGTTNARSIDYLGELQHRLLRPRGVIITQVQATILAEKPKLKPHFDLMRQNIATQLDIPISQVSIQGKTFEGKGVIGSEQGIGVSATIVLYAPAS